MSLPKVTFVQQIPVTVGLDATERRRPLYKLMQPFTFWINDKKKCVVPTGFVFDYNSVPWGLWNCFPPYHPLTAAASLIHDWCYAGEIFPRLYSDDLYLSAMIFRGVPKIKRTLMYRAVKHFGWTSYNKHTIDSVKAVRALSKITDDKRPLWEPVQ